MNVSHVDVSLSLLLFLQSINMSSGEDKKNYGTFIYWNSMKTIKISLPRKMFIIY